MPGSSTYASGEQPTLGVADPTTLQPWQARARYPEVAHRDSREEMVVDVSGPLPLAGTLVDIGVEHRETNLRRWETAYWQHVDGRHGVCATLLGVGNLRLRPGWYAVLVRPTVTGQQPILRAGRLIVE